MKSTNIKLKFDELIEKSKSKWIVFNVSRDVYDECSNEIKLVDLFVVWLKIKSMIDETIEAFGGAKAVKSLGQMKHMIL